jgi:hypothetical protein
MMRPGPAREGTVDIEQNKRRKRGQAVPRRTFTTDSIILVLTSAFKRPTLDANKPWSAVKSFAGRAKLVKRRNPAAKSPDIIGIAPESPYGLLVT